MFKRLLIGILMVVVLTTACGDDYSEEDSTPAPTVPTATPGAVVTGGVVNTSEGTLICAWATYEGTVDLECFKK